MATSKPSALHSTHSLPSDDDQTTPLTTRPSLPHPRRDSQFRAVAHILDKTISGRFIRTWSAWFLVALTLHIALYIGVAVQDLRRELYPANSRAAKANFLFVTCTAVIVPLLCRHFLTILAGALAGMLLGERGYELKAASFLLTANLGANLDYQALVHTFRSTEPGVRSVLSIRLVGNYIVHLAVPFIVLALVVHPDNEAVWMGYDWNWLLLPILWPAAWSLVCLLYMLRYWGSQECIRAGLPDGVAATMQVALDMALVVGEGDGRVEKVKGRWRYGHVAVRAGSVEDVDHSFLGLVREEECISLTEVLVALEGEGEMYGGKTGREGV